MYKFAKSLKFNELDAKLYTVNCGLMSALAVYDEVDNTFYFEYEHDGHMFVREYWATIDGVEEAIWEWLCTLSRFTTPDNHRLLGKKWKAMAAEAA